MNEEIRARAVRLISAEGEQVGIVPVPEAMRVARDSGLDLVEVAPGADPPVCRIMDYGKFKYQTSKKVQEARKKTRTLQLKEIKFRPRTEEHDLGFKIRNVRKFLEKKNRVKVSVTFRGREMAYMASGVGLLQKVAEQIADLGSMEQEPKQEGRNIMSMIIIPK